MNKIHPTAILSKKVELDSDIEIGPYCVIDDGVKIGKGSRLDTHVRIKGKTTIGEYNQFFHSCIVGETPQDSSYKNSEFSKLEIGCHNIFREFSQIHTSTTKEGTIVGNHNFVMGCVHIGHDVKIANHNLLIQGAAIGGHAVLADHVYLSALVAVHQHCHIGKHVIVGGMSAVTQDIPPFIMATGNYALARGVNSLGLRRAGISSTTRKEIKKAFKILYLKNTSHKLALQCIRKEILAHLSPNSEEYNSIEYLVNFIENTKRGIISSGFKKNTPT